MNRAIFILVMLSGLFLCGCDRSETATSATVEPTDKVFKWRMVTTWPANFPVFQEGAERFAEDVSIMSRGRLAIAVYGSGELVPALQVFEAVSQGAVEMGHGAAYYWAGKIPAAQFFSAVPFGMSANGMNAWLYSGGGLALWREIYQPFKLVPFPMGNTGVQMGGWFNKRVNALDDLKGLRMRIPGLGGKVLKKAGGNPVLMAGSEVYTALERNTIDATEWVAPFHDRRLGLDRAARYYYYPGWHEPGTVFELIINMDSWGRLPEDLQRIVEVAAAASNGWIHAQMAYKNQQALQQLKQEKKVEILPLPKQVLSELRQLTRQTLEEEASKDADFHRIYRAYDQFQRLYRQWHDISEEAYMELSY